MACGTYLFIVAIIIGFIVIGYAPDLLLRGLLALTNSISDGGAFAGGCIAGSLSTLLLWLIFERWMPAAGDGLFILTIFIAGAAAGAVAGTIWALFMDRYVRTCAMVGAFGGTVAAPISFFLFLFLAMMFFGG